MLRRGAGGTVVWVLGIAAMGGTVLGLHTVQRAAGATTVTLRPIASDFNNPIDVGYHQPSGKILLSVNYSNGTPNNFDLVAEDGSHTPFSAVKGLTDEVYIASVRSSACQGGFTVGQSFVGTGTPGAIARISPDGSHIDNPWVTLPGESGLLRGGVFQDRYCAFGGDLMVTTTVGDVWRVTSAGVPTRVATRIGSSGSSEGPTTVPNIPRYGPWAGTLLVGNETDKCVYSVTAAGKATCTHLGFDAEGVRVIPPGESFYAVDFADHAVMVAQASEFTTMVGDILVANETGALQHVHYDAGTGGFVAEQVAKLGQFEGSTFAPARVAVQTPTPGPTPAPTPTPCAGLSIGGRCTPLPITTTSSAATSSSVSTNTETTQGPVTTATAGAVLGVSATSTGLSVPRTGEAGVRDTVALGALLIASAVTIGVFSGRRRRRR
ncbi:MAG TPA: hypothetical protein VH134_14100 [Candidatus Dormibacteraeota bacterium]|nr:hypothetical protein [Candidatus Dormibacteraeota bacterium]